MSAQTIRLLIAGAFLVHGIGHTMLLGGVSEGSRRTISSIFWALASAGFVAASLSFLGILLPAAWWPFLAVGGSLVSLTGLVIFFGNWPVQNLLGAFGLNLVILASQVFLQGLPVSQAIFS